MAKIEERINKYTPLECGDMDDFNHAQSAKVTKWINNAYRAGATEQQKIDIEKAKAFAKKWLDELIQIYLTNLKDEPFYTKALEVIYAKLEKAMEE